MGRGHRRPACVGTDVAVQKSAQIVKGMPVPTRPGRPCPLPSCAPRCRFFRAFLVAILILCPAAIAEETPDFQENYLLGDWAGFRTSLWERGISPEFLLITDPYGNPYGGLGQGFTVYNMFCADLKLNTEKLLNLPGGEFHIGFAVNFGTQLSQRYVGNVFPIQSSDVAPPGPRLTNLSYTQSLFDDKLSLRAGRLAIDSLYGEEFAASEYFRAMTSVAFNAIPFAIFYNSPGAFGYPATTWGARAKFAPVEEFYGMVGIYNGDPDVGLANRYGVDFTFNGPPFGIAEIGWKRNQGKTDTGLPGNLKLGGFVLGGTTQKFDSDSTGGGRYGLYLVADQALLRFGDSASKRHLGVFGSFVLAPDESVSPMPYYFSAGLVAYGPLDIRPKDFVALGLAYGAYSDQLRPAKLYEATLEISYGIQVLPGLIIQPGAQILINPGGSPSVPSAMALGVNAIVSF
jgi:porin